MFSSKLGAEWGAVLEREDSAGLCSCGERDGSGGAAVVFGGRGGGTETGSRLRGLGSEFLLALGGSWGPTERVVVDG